ncbi:ATP-grasp domain-containing protein [Methylomonas albis]|uniref:ATP-grasp domain-containing protein n=2 Tax=Methylomonas albis TaxID=1854563 RepID=A0ABR9D667_9GAMM|nr:ATP-grasp domain-containing protein [Methylomonas albis]MBD9357367.1 ATP-grasp domain-containing protein [Methylomonas albis]
MEPEAAITVLRKDLLRKKWNALCTDDKTLHPVEYCLIRYRDYTFQDIVHIENQALLQSEGQFVVKPNALDASIAINVASCNAQLAVAISRTKEELTKLALDVDSLGISIFPEILVEAMIPRSASLHPGAEFSAEFISTPAETDVHHQLIGITQKYIDRETHVEVAHHHPSESFPPSLLANLEASIKRLLHDLKINCSISHWEFIVTTEDKLALVEGQLRPAGDQIMELIRLATGVDPYVRLFDAMFSCNNHEHSRQIPLTRSNIVAAVHFPKPSSNIFGPMQLDLGALTKDASDHSVTVSRDFFSANLWSSDSNWSQRYVAVLTVGDSYQSAYDQCLTLVSQLRLIGFNDEGAELVAGMQLKAV